MYRVDPFIEGHEETETAEAQPKRMENRGWRMEGFPVAWPSSAASAGTVPVLGSDVGKLSAQGTGGETPPKLAGEDACAT